MNNIDDIFDDKKLRKSVKKAKLKSTIKIIIIALIIFIIGTFANIIISLNLSAKKYEADEAYVKLTVPNGYISESNDIIGFLGGNGTYKIAKKVCDKSVILEDRISLFGLIPPMNYFRGTGNGYIVGGEWPVHLWENIYKKLSFFHPELNYKEYQNDLANLDTIPDGKIIEMAISFDKSYKIKDLYTIQTELQPSKITWAWLNEFTEEKMNEYRYSVENYDAKSAGIPEEDTIGIPLYSAYTFDNISYTQYYDEIIENLEKSYSSDHKKLYKEIMTKGKTSSNDAEILGVVIQGTKEDLKKIIGNPIIKASSFGVITDPIY